MLNENFRDMLSAFGEAGADYLLIGAYAMAAHGYPRATADIDIWVRPSIRATEDHDIGFRVMGIDVACRPDLH